MEKNINTTEYIDIARGIGIVMVVLGHSITKDIAAENAGFYLLRNVIYIVHMPLFFVISGFLFQYNKKKYMKYSKSRYVRKKFSALMIPYITYSILVYAIIYVGTNMNKVGGILLEQGYYKPSLSEFLLSVGTYIKHQDGHLWFCYVMFVVLVINRLLIRVNVSVTAILVCLFLRYTASWTPDWTPEIVWKTMLYLLPFLVGRYLYEQKLTDKRVQPIVVVSFVLLLLLILFRSGKVKWLYQIALPIAEIGCAISIFFGLSKAIEKGRMKRLKLLISFLGRGKMSFGIYLLHMPFLTSALVYVAEKLNLPTAFVILISTLVSLLLSVAGVKLISKSSGMQKLLLGVETGGKESAEKRIIC